MRSLLPAFVAAFVVVLGLSVPAQADFDAETAFLNADADVAAAKKHLTAHQAGTLARRAGVRRLVPFHFSTRYSGRGEEVAGEVMAAFGAQEVGS